MIRTLTFFALMLVAVACGSAQKKEKNTATTETEFNITELEKLNFNTDNPTLENAEALLKAYSSFAKRYPDKAETPEYLYKASGLALGLGKKVEALGHLDNIILKYNNYKNLDQVYFQKAFILDFEMEKKEDAELAYRSFIEKFPNSKLKAEAATRLETLYLSDEDLIELFKLKNKQ